MAIHDSGDQGSIILILGLLTALFNVFTMPSVVRGFAEVTNASRTRRFRER